MQNSIIILVVLIGVFFGIRESIHHFRGEGGCCGGASSKPPKKKLKSVIVVTYIFQIKGMHCKKCVNQVTRVINDFDGASAKVSLRRNNARVECDRNIDVECIKQAIEKRGYHVTEIRRDEKHGKKYE